MKERPSYKTVATLAAAFSLLPALAAGLLLYLAPRESIPAFFIDTTVDADSTTRVSERIEYDFGRESRRGIYRDIPDLRDTPELDSDDIVVSSPTVPDMWLVEWDNDPVQSNRCSNGNIDRAYSSLGLQSVPRLCIGDPDESNRGRHVYNLAFNVTPLSENKTRREKQNDRLDEIRELYEAVDDGEIEAADWFVRVSEPELTYHPYANPATTLVPLETGDRLVWEAIGPGWAVPIENVEIHLRTPFQLTDTTCQGADCTVEQIAPGHIKVVATDLDALDNDSDEFRSGETVELIATLGDPVPMATAPTPPPLTPRRSAGLLQVILTAFVASFVAINVATLAIMRRGRDLIYADDLADGQSSLDGRSGGNQQAVVRINPNKLKELATIAYEPPGGIEPWQAGIVDREEIHTSQQIAWLLQQAVDGNITFSGGKSTSEPIKLHDVVGRPSHPILNPMFSRGEITLGRYDSKLANAVQTLKAEHAEFLDSSPLWQVSPSKAQKWGHRLGKVLTLPGLIFVALGGYLMSRGFSTGLPILIPASIAFAVGMAFHQGRRFLSSRSPEGSAAWIRIESFRQYLTGFDADQIDSAAEQGVLDQYTAWAVALGEARTWNNAVTASSVSELDPAGFVLADSGSNLSQFSKTVTSPRSTSSRSSGSSTSYSGSSFSSGGGGGGGGSW